MTLSSKKDKDKEALDASGIDTSVRGAKLTSITQNFLTYVQKVPSRGDELENIYDAIQQDYQRPNHAPINASEPQQLAHLLAWLSVNYPGKLVPWGYLVMGLYGRKRAPTAASEEVAKLRKGSTVDRVLMKHYDMRLHRGPEVNARATRIDDNGEDLGRYALPKRTQAVHRANSQLNEVLHMIRRPSKIENPEIRRYVLDVAGAQKQITAAGLLKKLELPPSLQTRKRKAPASK